MDLAVACYDLTRAFPQDELFGMTSQIRRAGASVPATIAEGYGRDNRGDYVHHLRIAQGSLKELETHLESRPPEIVRPHCPLPIAYCLLP
jgi:four helix bundle protein